MLYLDWQLFLLNWTEESIGAWSRCARLFDFEQAIGLDIESRPFRRIKQERHTGISVKILDIIIWQNNLNLI